MDKEFEPTLLPAVVLAWEESEDMFVLKNQGYDIMDYANCLAISMDSDGTIYGLRPNKDGVLEWDLIVEVGPEGPSLGVVR